MSPVKDLLEAVDRARKKQELKNKYPYTPNKTYRIKAWTIRVYEDEHIIMCRRRDGLTSIISDDTDIIARIPDYVRNYLLKRGLLKTWKDAQIRKSAERLRQLATNYQQFLKKRNFQVVSEGYG